MDSGYVAVPRGVVEDVEQSAVDDRVEYLIEGVELKRVEDPEASLDTALGCFAACRLNRHRRDVDAEGASAQAGSEDRVLASAATGVEKCPRERAQVGEPDERGLWSADVPRR